MTINYKKIFCLFFAAAFLMSLAFSTIPVLADETGADKAKEGLNTSAIGTGLITAAPQIVVGTVIGAILSFLGVIFFVLIFYGGLRWMMASGNEQEVETAKKIIVAATIGLIIVLAAYAITAFIGEQLTTAGA
jgi:hypothetical protein